LVMANLNQPVSATVAVTATSKASTAMSGAYLSLIHFVLEGSRCTGPGDVSASCTRLQDVVKPRADSANLTAVRPAGDTCPRYPVRRGPTGARPLSLPVCDGLIRIHSSKQQPLLALPRRSWGVRPRGISASRPAKLDWSPSRGGGRVCLDSCRSRLGYKPGATVGRLPGH
jgi:hypothetical protein